VNITWASAIGQTYQLQYQTNLLSGAWINLGGSITSTGILTTASDPINPGAQRFYRVLLLQ
jgi:hypothetical protein